MRTRNALLGAGLLLCAGATGLLAQPQPRQDQRPAQPPAVAPGGAAPGEAPPSARPPQPGPVPNAQGGGAQGGNLDRLKQFRTTGTAMQIETVPQEGRRADALRRNLERIKLPDGFKIDLYAVVPDARHMAVAGSGVCSSAPARRACGR